MQSKTLLTVLALLAPATTGCLAVTDDEGPIMTVAFNWDARPNTPDFVAGDCRDADVRIMRWWLYRVEENEDGEVEDVLIESRTESCAEGLDVIEPKPGEYWLRIQGYDADDSVGEEDDPDVPDEPTWAANCPMRQDQSLVVLRFDVAYLCDIEAE